MTAAMHNTTGYIPRDIPLDRAVSITRDFTKLAYPTAWKATYRGIPLIKNPADLWVYQEIICEVRPDLIIETGTYMGGSALFMADVCEAIGWGMVYTVDIAPRAMLSAHPRIHAAYGDSLGAIIPDVSLDHPDRYPARRLVILDSDHTKAHVLAEMERFSPLVSVGSYLIVEDTNIAGNPIDDYSGDPYGAVLEFLKGHPEFEQDRSREKFLVTNNPGGYLRRIA